jgi:hypothetical protein
MKLQKKTTPKKPVKPVKGGTLSSRGVRRIGNVIRDATVATTATTASAAMLNKGMSIKPPVMANRTFTQPVAKSAMPHMSSILPTYPISHHPLKQLSQSPKQLSPSQIINIDRLLTYEMLGELYSHELLNVEIEILTKNAEKIAMEVIRGIRGIHATDINIEEELKKRFDETIERKISECKERARERLLYVYNTTMFGNSEGRIAGGKTGRIAGGKTGGIGSDTNSIRDAYAAWYGVDDTTNAVNAANAVNAVKADKTIFEEWKLSLNLFTFPSRVFVFCIDLLKQNRGLSVSATSAASAASAASATASVPNYTERMQEIHKGLLKTLKEPPRIDGEKLRKIEREFLSIAKGEVIHSLKERDKIETMKGDLTELYKAFQPPKSSSTYNGMFNFYQPFASKTIKLYGMPLPYQFDRGWIFRNILYVLETHNIKNYVDLHDCEGMTNIHGCNPYDFGGEREMFELAVQVSNHHHQYTDRKYINIRNYVDMTAGSSTAWISISEIPDTSIHETLVHCYAGMGRTGSVLLFLLLRDTAIFTISRDVSIVSDVRYDIVNRLQMPHLGYDTIFALHTALVKLFDTSYDTYAIDYVVKELLGATRIVDIHLLRKRLNRIFFFLAKKHITPSVYLYQSLPPNPDIFNKIKEYIRNKRNKTEGLSDAEIENKAHVRYGKRIMDGKDREYHFSKPVAIQMNREKWKAVKGMDENKLERILDGDTISSIFL